MKVGARVPSRPLYLLASDHRRSFERLLGIAGTPTEDDVQRMRDAKELVWKGFHAALLNGIPRDSAGILIDPQYGEHIAREAKRLGITFAIPIERSGQEEFEFEHQDRFADEVEDLCPTYVKALVRYNPEGDPDRNQRQRGRLQLLSGWLRDRPNGFLFELLVPPEPRQLEQLSGDLARYDHELRPALMRAAIEELQDAGIEPDLWKIEGLSCRDDCRAIAELVLRDGRCSGCLVLGRGASVDKVDEWLRAARGLKGYSGFAIGRSIFNDPLIGLMSGRVGSHGEAEALITRNFVRFVSVYEAS